MQIMIFRLFHKTILGLQLLVLTPAKHCIMLCFDRCHAGSFGFSDESCKLWITGDLFFCNSACLHLAFVNMDAFLRLKDPRHRRGRRVVTACSLLLWIGAPWSVSFVQVSSSLICQTLQRWAELKMEAELLL